MVGNPSVPAIALFTLALHTHRSVVAQEAASSASVDYYYNVNKNKSQRKRQRNKHLRRHAGSVEEPSEQMQYQHDGSNGINLLSKKEREVFRNLLESSDADLFRDLPPATQYNSQPSTYIIDQSSQFGTVGDGTDCTNRQWYRDISSPNMACTNSLSYPSSFNDPSIFEFDSSEACCESLFEMWGDTGNDDDDGKCSVIDDCSESITTASIPRRLACGNLGYHLNTETEEGCTNSDQYPPAWSTPQLASRMFHATPPACCSFFFPGGKACPIVDVCKGGAGPPPPPPPPPAPSASSGSASSGCQWHVDMVVQDGCSNDLEYPKEWESGPAKTSMFFDSAQQCCERMFSSRGGACKHYDRGCAVKPAPPPTIQSITPRPSRQPTPRPTSYPTKKPIVYYVDEQTGRCVNDEDKPMPEWIKNKYSMYRMCCRDARDPQQCLKTEPKTVNGIGTRIFFIDDKSGMCVEDTEIPKPTWVTETYSIYNLCCEAAKDTQLCRKAHPAGTNGGTQAPTPTPDPLYFADANGMCVNEYQTRRLRATYVDFKRCCVLASNNPEKCLSAGPPRLGSIGPTPVPLPVYYLKDSSSICVDENDVAKPDYIKDTFGDYEKCCKTGWDEVRCLAEKPTLVPTNDPTLSPSTPWPTDSPDCPDAYDSSGATVYERGSEVEVNEVIYRCKRNQNAIFCNQQKFEPPEEDPGPTVESNIPIATVANATPNSEDVWKGAWERIGICTIAPTASPSMIPTTYAPTCLTRWHPGDIKKRICTNSDQYPSLWDYAPLSETYFADTAEECCQTFYNGRRCRIRDDCNVA
mmetsp:Transcript_8277/g.18531  ORF Transcript_8277/g.18531 Transcript_8277/m.18531 type:complete len:807 (-) Transcript_8277:157-2577(-)